MGALCLLAGLCAGILPSPAWASGKGARHGGSPSAAPSDKGESLRISPDGGHLIDAQKSLVWTRCAAGLVWNGQRCAGRPMLLTHAQALKLVADRRKASGLPWRLPHVADLRRLSMQMHANEAAPQLTAVLDDMPIDWYWSSTPVIADKSVNPYNYNNIMRGVTPENSNRLGFLHGWAVDLHTGQARDNVEKKSRLAVVLVRSN